ncbi:MAG TPA: hypothetical protein VF017_09550 [Thermoanaerobaculia bacterium]|nr:hypothetical protein [Thermoanaerobaculia bacterium]
MLRRSLLLLLALALLVPSLLAADPVVFSGVDAFRTVASRTFADLANDPIPAGFFCPGSAPFAGKIQLKGVPIAVEPAAALGGADTVFLRLDDAVFNEEGIAQTRLQMQALSLASVKPIRTSCGAYRVRVTLADGAQPISPKHHMTIVRENERGGYFLAEFEVRYKLTFVPVAGGASRELERTSRFTGGADHKWAFLNQDQGAFAGSVKVDTNGDGKPDTSLAGVSNFAVGRRASRLLGSGGPSASFITAASSGCGGSHDIQ